MFLFLPLKEFFKIFDSLFEINFSLFPLFWREFLKKLSHCLHSFVSTLSTLQAERIYRVTKVNRQPFFVFKNGSIPLTITETTFGNLYLSGCFMEKLITQSSQTRGEFLLRLMEHKPYIVVNINQRFFHSGSFPSFLFR